MTKLIIDTCLFEIPSFCSGFDQIEHFALLKDTIKFAYSYLDVSLDEYYGAPYSYKIDGTYYSPPITSSLTVRNRYSEIRKEIQKLIAKGEFIELPSESIEKCPLTFEEGSVTETPFMQYLYYQFVVAPKDAHSYLLLLSDKNKTKSPTVRFGQMDSMVDISAIYKPSTDCHGIVSRYLKGDICIDAVFPQAEACSGLNDAFKMEVKQNSLDENARKPLYIKYGTELASRNLYQKKPDISRKNPNYCVFVHKNDKFFLSVDEEHGGVEVFKRKDKELYISESITIPAA